MVLHCIHYIIFIVFCLFSEVWFNFSVEVETGVEVIHWVAFVAGDGETPSLVWVEAEAAVDNDGVAIFGNK